MLSQNIRGMFRKECYGAVMAVAYPVLTRIAGAFVFAAFTTLSGPLALAAEPARPEPIPNGLLCTDQMETEPDSDDVDPTEIADTVDGAVCAGSDAPLSV
jgi:hypothetical protein